MTGIFTYMKPSKSTKSRYTSHMNPMGYNDPTRMSCWYLVIHLYRQVVYVPEIGEINNLLTSYDHVHGHPSKVWIWLEKNWAWLLEGLRNYLLLVTSWRCSFEYTWKLESLGNMTCKMVDFFFSPVYFSILYSSRGRFSLFGPSVFQGMNLICQYPARCF